MERAEQTSFLTAWADWFDDALARLAARWRDLGVAAFLGGVAVVITLISFNFAQQIILPNLLTLSGSVGWNDWWNGFFQNFGTEMFGALATFVLLQGIVGAREKASDRKLQEEIAAQIREELRLYIQAQEIARLHSAANRDARQPILDSMKATGLLAGAGLGTANLERANLGYADLEGARLYRVNLEEAQLHMANLRNTGLRAANLTGAFIWGADLTGALFLTVDQLRSVKTLKGSILPDGTRLPDYGWKTEFERWLETTETRIVTVSEVDYDTIVPLRTEGNSKTWDFYYND